jgi:hypothetical protein
MFFKQDLVILLEKQRDEYAEKFRTANSNASRNQAEGGYDALGKLVNAIDTFASELDESMLNRITTCAEELYRAMYTDPRPIGPNRNTPLVVNGDAEPARPMTEWQALPVEWQAWFISVARFIMHVYESGPPETRPYGPPEFLYANRLEEGRRYGF